MVKCTPEQRAELVSLAKNSDEMHGTLHDCRYKVMEQQNGVVEVDILRQNLTNITGEMIYANKGQFAALSLACYNELYKKLSWYGPEIVKVFIKGGNAIALQCPLFDFSDLDIGIYINPSLNKNDFDEIYNDIAVICGQIISKHKQNIDRLFFRQRENAFVLLSDKDTDAFKECHKNRLNTEGYTSSFTERNAASSNSIFITGSDHYDDKVVRIDMPHYENAERIPLEYTPIHCSINDTIFNMYEDGRISSFDLFRIKWGNVIENDENEYKKRIFADFIDISLLRQDDSELQDFFERGGFYQKSRLTSFVIWNGWKLTCASLEECIVNLHKSIYLFDCPEAKKHKKMETIELIEFYLQNN